MFADCLNTKVNIVPMVYNTNNRVTKDQAKNDSESAIYNVSCRIIDDEKAMFMPDVKINIGDRIDDLVNQKSYKVTDAKNKNALDTIHHITVTIEKKVI